MMDDLPAKLREYACQVADGSAVMCVAPMKLLEDAAREIESLRQVAGKAAVGQSAHDLMSPLRAAAPTT